MKNKLFRRAAVLTAALFSLTCMSVTAYAQSDEPAEETTPPAATETVAKPFTPDGTGTVVDNATVEDVPFALLQKITDRITHEVDGVNRVLYDLTPKPTGTIEWE